MTIVAVTDTGPLIHLAEIGAIRLRDLVDELCIPDTVYRELGAGGLPRGFQHVEFSLVETKGELEASEGLDPGEEAALQVEMDRGAMLRTDDLAPESAGPPTASRCMARSES